MGGSSLEREVSFNSGRTICDYIDKQRYNVISLFITASRKLYKLPWQFVYRGKISDFEHRLPTEAQEIQWEDIKKYIDFAYLALHGNFGEDGVLQGFFETLGIPFSGSPIEANIIAFNKLITNDFLHFCQLKTPKIYLCRHQNDIINDIYLKKFFEHKKQVIVKPIKEGSSIGISYVDNLSQLHQAIYCAMHINQKKPQDVIVQEYIHGNEFTIIAIEKNDQWEIFNPTEIEKQTTVYTYEKKYLPGAIQKHTPARFSDATLKEIYTSTKTMVQELHAHDIIRFDGIVEQNTNTIFFLDINTFPGTAPSSYVFLQGSLAGYHNAEIINNIIENSISRFLKNTDETSIKNKYSPVKTNYNVIKINKKMRIAILLGGDTNEREISLESGRNVFHTISSYLFDKKAIFVSSQKRYYEISLSQITKDTTESIESTLQPKQEIIMQNFKSLFDFIFIALHGGYGENGELQKELEMLGIPYNGSGSQASQLGMNKYKTAKRLSEAGLIAPKQLLIEKNSIHQDQQKQDIMSLFQTYKKIILKPHDDGCSAHIYCAHSYQDAMDKLNLFWVLSTKTHCLIEGAINGIEITVGCIGNRPEIISLPITETVKNNIVLSLEEKFLPGCGENITPARLSEKATKMIHQLIQKAYMVMQCDGYARIDSFWLPHEEKLLFLEFNTLPALTPATCLFHQSAEINLSPQDLLHYIIYLGFSKHNKEKLCNYYDFRKSMNNIEHIIQKFK